MFITTKDYDDDYDNIMKMILIIGANDRHQHDRIDKNR